MSDEIDAVLKRLEEDQEEAVKRLFSLLEIPSISTNPEYQDECLRAANWCTEILSDIGFDASVRPTAGQPMVLAHYTPEAGSSLPHVLFYGHYDVQPPEPLELWEKPPFEPWIADDPVHGKVIVARGSSDDKGQFMTFFEACRAWIKVHGSLPVAVTILLEGEEESGSPSLAPFLEANKEELRADIALVCDTTQWDASTPAITTMLRGLAFSEVTLYGPGRDLHSGMYGGPALNPIRALTTILGDLWDERGRIQIDGFYDDIIEPEADQLQAWRALGFDANAFLQDIDLSLAAGENDRSALEQLWSRPTLEINGIIGGYTGPGTKTVIPAEASAKLSFRLVPGQDPDKIIIGLHKFFNERLPADARVKFSGEGGSPAVGFDTTTPPFQAAAKVLHDEFGKPALMMGCGASIPIVSSFRSALDMDSLLIGFALNDDKIHSPNEKYNMSSFIHGTRAWARLLKELGNQTTK